MSSVCQRGGRRLAASGFRIHADFSGVIGPQSVTLMLSIPVRKLVSGQFNNEQDLQHFELFRPNGRTAR
jgi:hypothetical protein